MRGSGEWWAWGCFEHVLMGVMGHRSAWWMVEVCGGHRLAFLEGTGGEVLT